MYIRLEMFTGDFPSFTVARRLPINFYLSGILLQMPFQVTIQMRLRLSVWELEVIIFYSHCQIKPSYQAPVQYGVWCEDIPQGQSNEMHAHIYV